MSEHRNHAVNESDRGSCRSRVGFPRPSTYHFSTRPSHLLITRVFPDARLLNTRNILVREELSHEKDRFAVRSHSLCRYCLCPGCAHRARQEGLTSSSKSHPKRQRCAYPGS